MSATDHSKSPGPSLDGVGITPEPEPEIAKSLISVDTPAHPNPGLLEALGAATDSSTAVDTDLESLFVRAYYLVSAALLLSAIVASQVTIPDDMLSRQFGIQLLFLLEVACVAVLARYVPQFPTGLAAFLLFFCAAVNGVSFCFFLMMIPPAALAYGFLLCAIVFAITALAAQRSHIDLSGWRGMALLSALGVPILTLIAIMFRVNTDYWATSFVGFAVFSTLVWYFSADIRALELEFDDDPTGWKSAICAALILYLNFINLYLIVMRVAGQKSRPESYNRRVRF